ncbi:MAG: hypothetical protein C0507_07585 [Cyanobacteria bacterium PR.3.49]|nr:hypothetical protein [Cyanobacteria bacterium PR.3.49]
MVETIYGPQSLEMANRLSTLAGHLNNYPLEDYAGAVIARKRAMAIFKTIGKQDRYAENFGFLAFELIETGHTSEARKTVQQAIEIANSSGLTGYERNMVLDSLYAPVWQMGDKTWSNQIRAMQTKTEALEEKDSDVPILLWVCAALLLPLNFAIGASKRRLLNQLESKWKMAMLSSDTIEIEGIYLNKLINLEMFRGKIELADSYSCQLLKSSFGNHVSISDNNLSSNGRTLQDTRKQ